MRYQPRSSTEPEPCRLARWLAVAVVALVACELAYFTGRTLGCN
ncbi:hypothetical protein [Massilia eurypsychrophila]|nr:hypothetical protein [Massilia eurypsychrophila]